MKMVRSTRKGAFLIPKKGGYKKGLAKKLKNLKVTSVDFVDEGANQRADINLFKRRDSEGKPQDSMFKRFVSWLKGEGMDEAQIEAEIQKAAVSFNEQIAVRNSEQIDSEIWNATSALRASLYSIVVDTEMDAANKPAAMTESVNQFATAMQEYIPKWCAGQTAIAKSTDNDTLAKMEAEYQALGALIGKLKPEDDEDDDDINEDDVKKGELEEMLKIDKSKMTPEEAAAYDEIIKKYAVDEPEENPETDPVPQETNVGKSKEGTQETPEAPVESAIVKALKAEIAETRKSLDAMKDEALTKEVTEVAKKYLPLGKKVEELVPVLKQMKAGGEELYNNYVALLDQQLDIQKSSGIFTEIGKSTTGDATGDPEKMWITKARELMKTRTDLTLQQAMDEVALTDDELRAQIDQ